MDHTLAYHITLLYRDFLAYTTRELKALGLHFGQLPLVVYIGKYPACTQADLTRSLKLDWGYSQRSIRKLVDGGFITKEYDRARACNCLRLTERGGQAFALSHSVFAAWDQIKTDHLTPEEAETLQFLIGKLTEEREHQKDDEVL